jgi:hypothetical protein
MFVLREIKKNSVVIGDFFSLSFVLSGTNSDSFLTPAPVKIIFVDPLSGSYNINPLASDVVDLTVNNNKVQMTLQCDQPAIIYWVIGLSPSVDQ